MRKILPLCAVALLFSLNSKSQAVSPYSTCPDVNIGIARNGFNADYGNPNHLYNVSSTTGTMTLVPGGPYKDPSNPGQNLEINAIGVNSKDGFIYGFTPALSVSGQILLRLDKNYGVTKLAPVAAPSVTNPFTVGFINSAAGDIDASGNYYFTAGIVNSSGQLTNFKLGRISNVQALTPTTGIIPDYFEINFTAGCLDFVSTFQSDPSNSGIRDISYNPTTNSFFSYATYKPSGSSDYKGRVIEIKPVVGSNPLTYEMVCSQVVNSHPFPQEETAGTLIDKAGNFLVLMTNGVMGKIGSSGSFQYTGQYNYLNANANPTLTYPIRGDLATCNVANNIPLPVRLSGFTVSGRDCSNTFNWTAENEVEFSRYELEQSTDNVIFSTASTVAARRTGSTAYKVTLPSAGRTTYYRLKLIDNNGSFVYSRTLNVASNCAGKTGFMVTPNPVSRQLNMNWYGVNSNSRIDIVILNAGGGVVSRTTRMVPAGTSNLSIDVSSLPNGAYWIKALDTENNSSFENKFMKQ